MGHTRSSATTKRSAPPQRLRSFRTSVQHPPLHSPTASLRRSSRQHSSAVMVKMERNPQPGSTQKEDATLVASKLQPSETQDEKDGLTEYERKRRENIQRNLAFMQQMGVSTAKIQARTAVGPDPKIAAKRHKLAAKRAHQAAQKAERLTQPVRKSRRLEGKQVELEPIDTIDQLDGAKTRALRAPRRSHLRVMDAVDGESKAFLGTIIGPLDDELLEDDTLVSENDRVDYTLADADIIKAVQERIYSVAFLPRADRVVVACGDKLGHVALWTPRGELEPVPPTASPVAVYRPHNTPVSQLIFADASTLLSSSFDGTVRAFNLRAATSSIVYESKDTARITSMVAASTAQGYYISCDDGSVRQIDRRESNVQSVRYQLHDKKINTVHQHPRLDFYIATASLDRTVCLWDTRRLSVTKNTPVVTLRHSRSVNCAYFSPQEGQWLVTVGQDSYLDMFATSSLATGADQEAMTLPASIRVRHNNNTGRWLTKLHAAWDPKRPTEFVIGCMEQPRRLQIFQAGRRRPVHELTSDNFASVHSINAFHPQLELIAGGNSSGRVALWRGQKTMDKS